MKTAKGNFLFHWEGELLIMLTLPASFSYASVLPTRPLFKFKKAVILFYISSIQAAIKSVNLNDPVNCLWFLAPFSPISFQKYTYALSMQSFYKYFFI